MTLRRQTKSYWRKFENMLLVDHLFFLHVKQSMKKPSFGNRRIYAKLLTGLMLVNYIHIRCVNPCRPVFRGVGISIQKPAYSHLNKTKYTALKFLSCPFSTNNTRFLKLKASIQKADKRKMTASVLMALVRIAKLPIKPCVAFTTFFPVEKCVHHFVKRISNVAVIRESSMH